MKKTKTKKMKKSRRSQAKSGSRTRGASRKKTVRKKIPKKKLVKKLENKVHFVGIGGIGMSSLARYYLSEGWIVTGSDAYQSDVTNELKRERIKIEIGHKRSNVGRPERLIYSAAVPEDNPERLSAKKKKILELSYAEALGELTRQYKTIAVAGSHGKSSTTAMLAIVLIKAGFDPTVILGTKLKQLGGNFRKGKSEWLLIEADDYNKSFHKHTPQIAIITNVDKEHLDTYKNYRGVISGFSRFAKKVLPGGFIVANWKDKGVREAVMGTKARVKWYNKTPITKRKLNTIGIHNQENAEAVARVAKELKITKKLTEEALSSYKGAWRRLEKIRPKINKVAADLYTDYAHHPTEVHVTLMALKDHHKNKKLICVFQPHQEDRFNRLFNDFKKSFDHADLAILMPIYSVEGREEGEGKTAKNLVEELDRESALHVDRIDEIVFSIEMFSHDRPVVVFMSAGDLDKQVRDHFGVK